MSKLFRSPQLTKVWNIVRVSWFLICVVVATAIGAYYGYNTYGWFGAVGTSLLGLIIGTIVGAAPQLLWM
ncbi:autophagy-related protein 27 [Phyllobacterium zundukense]|jgi:membrane protein YdbS with pleckstrin-like domain|uniref:autophagy-related protein 27 n=1 Tax=Phyllobacterium zundukense TaxID=1867719 RepID=UPI0021CAD61D|nr:autophagy-related protein 27 [Phyllobacterium zundukense]